MFILCMYDRRMAAAVAKSTGCKNSYSLMKLPNHNRILQTFPDAMHTVKDAIERVFFLLIGKSKLDKIAVLERKLKRFGFDEETRKRKRGSQTTTTKVHHPYVLSPDELKLADARSKAIIMTNADFNPGEIFFRTTGLKSHDWKEVLCMCVKLSVLASTLGWNFVHTGSLYPRPYPVGLGCHIVCICTFSCVSMCINVPGCTCNVQKSAMVFEYSCISNVGLNRQT